MRQYNPYPYSSTMRYYYNGGPTPQDVAKVAKVAPERLQHLNSVWQLSNWMATNMPDAYKSIIQKRPDLMDPASVVLSGSLGAKPAQAASTAGKPGMSGLGDDLITSPPDSTNSPITAWGSQLFDLAKGALALDQQRKLLATNLSLAERGLPPIDPGSIAPTVSVGISRDVQKLGLIAVGGLVIVGLAVASAKRRK